MQAKSDKTIISLCALPCKKSRLQHSQIYWKFHNPEKQSGKALESMPVCIQVCLNIHKMVRAGWRMLTIYHKREVAALAASISLQEIDLRIQIFNRKKRRFTAASKPTITMTCSNWQLMKIIVVVI